MENNSKVLHVTPLFLPENGGVSIYVSNITSHLADLGHKITIIAPKQINKKIKTSDLVNIIRIPSIYLPGWPLPLRTFSIPLDGGKKIDKIIYLFFLLVYKILKLLACHGS